MIPTCNAPGLVSFGIPRESGDDPQDLELREFCGVYSPRERG